MAQTTFRDYLQETEDALTAGRLDEALAHCQRILTQFPESLDAQRLLGEIYLAQDEFEAAQQSFDWVLMNDPESVVAYCNRALVCERMSDFDTALDCYQQAYELSRGNGQIRQQFNKLSARIGQPGFMFSRAGLARLYMRGDLLQQAIQEWEAVLAVSPERLDARLGLLETYWREDATEQVERLAKQILQEVPGCLKALLLLAYTTASRSVAGAQDLLKQAQDLDPEMQMALELFADLIARQPSHPFLQLWQKTPVMIDLDDAAVETSHSTQREASSVPVREMAATSVQSPSWDSFNNWSGLDSLAQPQQGQQSVQEVPAFAGWGSSDSQSAAVQDPWSALEAQYAQASSGTAQAQPFALSSSADLSSASTSSTGSRTPMNSVPALEEYTSRAEKSLPSTPVQDSWGQQEMPNEPSFGGDMWGSGLSSNRAVQDLPAWEMSSQESSSSAPSWLSMLTQSEPMQPAQTNSSASPSFPVEHQPLSSLPASVEQPEPIEVISEQQPPQPVSREQVQVSEPRDSRESRELQQAQPVIAQDDDEEPSFFSPDWLRSLGARTMPPIDVDDEEPAVMPSEPVVANASQMEQESVWNSWSQLQQETASVRDASTPAQDWSQPQQPQEVSSENWSMSSQDDATYNWSQEWQGIASDVQEMAQPEVNANVWQQSLASNESDMWNSSQSWMSQPESVSDEGLGEQNLVNTLENLEQDLFAKGFIPLEPNSLSSIAQVQPLLEEEEQMQPQVEQEDESLSSAFAQFGPLAPSSMPSIPATPVFSPPSFPEPASQPVEPSWIAALRSVPAPAPVERNEPVRIVPSQPTPSAPVAPSIWQPAASVSPAVPQSAPVVPPVRRDVVPGPVFEPAVAPSPALNTHPEPVRVPVARGEALLDAELEVTMKRPAIRLQPAQQRVGMMQQATPAAATRGRINEPAVENRLDSATDAYRERLLRGYQHQLVGDYDEAMQEYRLIIRNAPELLGEVVSNVRALLKLAPKYSAGYRVLGDAYMRQGEYLQAMEAYNKALTMAKKAKG